MDKTKSFKEVTLGLDKQHPFPVNVIVITPVRIFSCSMFLQKQL